MQATAFEFPPFTTKIRNESGAVLGYGGFEYEIFTAVAGHLNFGYTIAEPVMCCFWGLPTDDTYTNFTGLVGDLLNGFSDVGWANIFVGYDYKKYMAFTTALDFHYTRFLVTKVLHELRIRRSLLKFSPILCCTMWS